MTGARHWVLVTLVMAALPSLLRLPWWVTAIALAGGVLHYAGRWRRGWSGRLLSAALLAAAVAGIWSSFETWFSGDGVLSFFIAVVFLKWGESTTRRDYLLLIFAAVILAAVGTLYWENMLNMLHIFLVVFLLAISLMALHLDASKSTLKFLLSRTGLIFALALPLMLLLFLFFPRIPGPLWDVGLAFGLPIKAMMDRGDAEFGKMTSLQPGGISRATNENQNVLIAEFDGAVPFKSQLYWRGPVFWEFDGQNWNLPEDWDNRSRLLSRAIKSKARWDREVREKKDPVRYTLRVMPNGGRWLYGLEMPAEGGPEVFISNEFQLLSVRRIDDHEPKLQTSAYLTYSAGASLTEEQRTRGLSWPEGQNPRLRALGRALREHHSTTTDLLYEIYATLRRGDYTFDPGYLLPPGDHLLDRFFFDEKRGGAEYLAGSTVLLLRAAGIPARLVAGFRGGTIIALTNFVIVKQADAHAWVEAWDDGRGWFRVEPKDIVVAPDDKRVETKVDEKKQGEVKMEMKKEQAPPAPTEDEPQPRPKTPQAPPKPKTGWQLPDWTAFLGDLQKWVIDYDPDRQIDIMKGVGLEDSDWLDLMIGTLLGLAAILGCYLAVAWFAARERVDRVAKAWGRFCRRLAKFDLRKEPHECPRDFMQRVGDTQPEMATATGDIIGRYIDIRYGGDGSKRDETIFIRQVERFLSMT
ncbi:transglutaminase-like enzyme, predicted cysteine protease [Thioflavicoccus mobilis 8321]|uniref:Transglutaminase-like enzyme, predicted cysteine protease n=1 Tax=Thioflavicoccus mobilis 8321 TaxID=765912 RepID=L0GRY2_9GAMM|nr:transglutaminaseTgpA domain-containing protein [Thioflavicoccus mobilis]AGA89498.1 transglutaminase-like enzyme, predicted cysteine protease [Thioflavicoccus mobilis 8321]